MAMSTAMKASSKVNGLDLDALAEVVREIERDPRKGMVAFRVHTAWRGPTPSRPPVESYTIGGARKRPRLQDVAGQQPQMLRRKTRPPPPEKLVIAPQRPRTAR